MPRKVSIFVSTVCLVAFMAGCSSKPEDTLETRGEFVSRMNDGNLEFAYTFFWFNSIENQLDKRDRRTRLAAYLSGYSAPLTSEQKIRLEDQAAANLKDALSNRDLCQKGYAIDKVIWRDRSLSLIGQCSDQNTG